jgi:formamidase
MVTYSTSVFLTATAGTITNPPTLSDYNGTNNSVTPSSMNADQSSTVGQIGVNATEWPFIQTFDFTQGEFDIVLEQAGADEIVTLDYNSADLDDYSSLTLDRNSGTQGASVHLTITDNQLNIDPTNEDIVVFNVATGAESVSFTNGTVPNTSGLAIGDLHYAQGDGEVSGTAIEMSADVWATTEVLKNGPDLSRGPHYEGSAQLLDIPSRRFYAVTGIPVKAAGDVPPDMRYLNSDVVAGLENLPNDINLAARNAVEGIVDYIVSTYGYNRQQAYVIASVAVDIRISQLVDAPNIGVTALLPLDIFIGEDI